MNFLAELLKDFFNTVSDSEVAAPIVEKVFDSIAVTLNQLLKKVQGDQLTVSLPLLEECRQILKKAELVFRKYPDMIGSSRGLDAYNRVVALKPLHETLLSEMATSTMEQVEVVLARRWAQNTKLYGSEASDLPPLELKDLRKHLENIEYAVICKEPRNQTTDSFLKCILHSFDFYVRKLLDQHTFSRRGLDIMLDHVSAVASTLEIPSFADR